MAMQDLVALTPFSLLVDVRASMFELRRLEAVVGC
jgi:hypothetical protein